MQWAMAHGYAELNPAGEIIDGARPAMPKVKADLRALPFQDIPAALASINDSHSSRDTTLAQLVPQRHAEDPRLREEIVAEETRRVRSEVLARHVLVVQEVPHPGLRGPAAAAVVHEHKVVLAPGIDLIADGVEFAGVRLALPIVVPAQGQQGGRPHQPGMGEAQPERVPRRVRQVVAVEVDRKPVQGFDAERVKEPP